MHVSRHPTSRGICTDFPGISAHMCGCSAAADFISKAFEICSCTYDAVDSDVRGVESASPVRASPVKGFLDERSTWRHSLAREEFLTTDVAALPR